MSITKKYGETVHVKIPPYFATFPPTTNIDVGDFGIISDGIFQRIDNVSVFNLNVNKEKSSGIESKFILTSGKEVSVYTGAGSDAHTGNIDGSSDIKIQFSKKNSFFFAAGECTDFSISGELAVHEKVIDLFMSGKWQPEWYLVRSVKKAGYLTMLTSEGPGSEISFRGKFQDEGEKATLGLHAAMKVSSKGSFGTEIVGLSGSPFVKLLAVRRKFLSGAAVPKIDLIAAENFRTLENARLRCIQERLVPEEIFQIKEVDESDTLF